MPKNPIFEFLRQRGKIEKVTWGQRNTLILPPVKNMLILPPVKNTLILPSVKNTLILPTVGIPVGKKEFIPEFSFSTKILKNEDSIINTIYANPHPTDVLADSSLWSPKRLDLVRRLLISNTIRVLPVVRNELADIEKQKPSPMRELIFPEGKLNPKIVIDKYFAVKDHQFVMTRYTNLLHMRKRMLERPFNEYIKETGRQPVGKDRSKIIDKASLKGLGWRTIRLANKGDPRRRYTDEVLAVYGILSPILSGRDCIILTADNDIFDQVYQFSVLLHDDYGSFLIGRDYMNNPAKYPHFHESSSPFMKEGAIAIGREEDPTYLLPKIKRTCATWVIDVNNLHCITWISIQEIKEALDFQERVHDGRVADGGNDCNVHMSLYDQKCKIAPYHFTIGRDKILKSKSGINSFLSEFDLFRVCTDR